MAREGYLHDAGESTIHDDSYLQMSKKEKRKNWWYYHKWWVMIITVILIMIGYYTFQYVTYVTPDYYVAFMSQISIEDSALTDLADHFELYGEDRNGDGEVKVEVVMYSCDNVSSDDVDYYESLEAFHAKYISDYNVCQSMIWIIDEASYQMIGEQVETVYKKFDEKIADPENLCWIPVDSLESMSDIKFPNIKGYNYGFDEEDLNKLLSRYNLCLRLKEDSQIEFKEELIDYHTDSEKLLNNLINNRKMVEG